MSDAAVKKRVKDPVCGMDVDPAATPHHQDHGAATYHFCGSNCAAKFRGDPEHYLNGAHREAAADAPAGAQYTCPMHPEVVQDGPGSCPICGMALEPMTWSPPSSRAQSGADRLHPSFLDRRCVLGLPVFLLEMGEPMVPGITGPRL